MILKIGGVAGPCPPCKIILNGGFIAALAPVLAVQYAAGADVNETSRHVSEAAHSLAAAARIHAQMLTLLGISVVVGGNWEGCEQAKLLVRWITLDGDDAEMTNAIEQMDKWASDFWSAIADLVAGKLPTG